MFISCLGPCRGCILRPAGPPECGAFAASVNAAQVVTATRYTRSSINRFIDRARVGDAGRRAGGCRRRRRRRAGATATAGTPASAKEASNWCLAWVLALGKSS